MTHKACCSLFGLSTCPSPLTVTQLKLADILRPGNYALQTANNPGLVGPQQFTADSVPRICPSDAQHAQYRGTKGPLPRTRRSRSMKMTRQILYKNTQTNISCGKFVTGVEYQPPCLRRWVSKKTQYTTGQLSSRIRTHEVRTRIQCRCESTLVCRDQRRLRNY